MKAELTDRGVERLIAVVQELSRARALETVQAIVRRAARELTGADGATFVLRDGDRCFYADEDAIAPLWKGQRFPMSTCISGWAMLHREATVAEDIYKDDRIPHDAYRPTFVKSLAMVPIRRESPIGAIGTYWAEVYRPTEEDLALLQALADSTSIALENVALYGELEDRVRQHEAAVVTARAAEAEARRALEERLRAEAALAKIEKELRQAQKMEAVGKLAAGVAHDFNNMLSVILSYSSLIAADLPPTDPIHEQVSEIADAGTRAAGLTRQLLAFSRQQVLEPRVVDINATLTGIDRMIRRVIVEDVHLDLRTSPGLHRVLADPGQIEQVILNLVVNARDAMPDGGRITIETSNVQFTGEYARTHLDVAEGDYVMLAVSDTGFGMDAETQARIFEPFFTTKEAGKGTGLGLSTVYGIVKQSGGHIWVYSEPGVGTSFKVYFPRLASDAIGEPVSRVDVATFRGTETILLVEDDAHVRAVAKGILSRNGYQIIEAGSAEDATRIVREYASTIQLLLTDVVMARTNGVELAGRLTAERPNMKVLCMSGFTDEVVMRRGIADARIAFLQKPITPETLLQKVRSVLDASR